MRVRAALLAVVALAVAAPSAWADSDPASDTLITGDVFYPYRAPAQHVQDQLDALVKRAHAAHYPVKVALIGSVDDLGGAGDLYGQPARYATFLSNEISFNSNRRLLVVMPQGVGVANAPGKEADAALGRQEQVSEGDADALARVAMRAVAAMAGAAGHDLPLPKGVGSGGGSSGGGGASFAIFLVPVVLLLLAIFLARLKGRSAE